MTLPTRSWCGSALTPRLAEVGEPHQHETAVAAAQVQLDLAWAEVVTLIDRRAPVAEPSADLAGDEDRRRPPPRR